MEQIRPVENKLELWAYGSDGERLLPDTVLLRCLLPCDGTEVVLGELLLPSFHTPLFFFDAKPATSP